MYSTYFKSWVTENIIPCGLVYSTKSAKDIFLKNNLSPAEFLRPFGDFTKDKFDIIFSENDINSISNFKIDFYNSEQFIQIKKEEIPDYLNKVMTSEKIRPNWSINDTSFSNKNIEIDQSKLKYYSLPWFRNFEKILFETLYFNPYELYQQPLIVIYICSLNEDPNVINELDKGDNLPFNLKIGYYNQPEIKLIIVLNDNSDPDKYLNENDFQEKKDKFQGNFNKSHCILYWNINMKKNLDEVTKDIWSKYFHLNEKYDIENEIINNEEEIIYGKYITDSEINTYKNDLYNNFFISYALPKLFQENDRVRKIIEEKNKKIQFTSLIFKKEEILTSQGILKTHYKELYDYGMINFFFRNYKTAEIQFKNLYNDLKKTNFYLPIYQKYMICKFINSINKKEDYNNVYIKLSKRKQFNDAVKWACILIKMYEDQNRFDDVIYFYDKFRHTIHSNNAIEINMKNDLNKIPKLQSYHYFKPLLLEKIGIYFRLEGKFRKFLLFSYKTGEAYSNLENNMHFYSLNAYGNLFNLIDNPSNSFVTIREDVNSKLGEISLIINDKELIIKFYKNCIEFAEYTNKQNQNLALYFKSFLTSIKYVIDNNLKCPNINIKSLNIPQIDNSSIFITEQEDYDIALISKERGYEKIQWNVFNKYAEVLSSKPYSNLDERDLLIIRNLDNVIMDKEKYSNFFNRRIFQGNINEKIYLKIKIKNPLDINLSLKAELLCEFVNENKNENEEEKNPNSNIEFNQIDITLQKKKSIDIELYVKPLSPGKIYINGLKLYLFESFCEIIHLFNEKNKNKLYSYRKKSHSSSKEVHRTSNASSKSSHSNPRDSLSTTHSNKPLNYISKKAKIIYEIKSPEEDIIVLFPMNKELSMKQHQLILFPIILKNNSKEHNIKRFTIFLEDSLNRNNNNRIPTTIFDYIHRNISLKGNNRESIVHIPFIPQVSGTIYIKILIKFEDDLKSKPCEVRRFIIKINVLPSLNLFAEENIINFDNENNEFQKIYFSTLLSTSINDDGQITNLEMGNILFGKVFSLKEKSKEMIWKKMTDNKKEKNYCKFDLIYNFKEGEDKENFSFLEMLKEYDYITKKLTSILNRSNYFLINWSANDKNDNSIINGIYFYSVKLGTPKFNYPFLLNLFHISTELNIKKTKINDRENLVTVTVNLNKKGINQIKEISKYEIFVVNEIESNINWIGLKLYSIDNNQDENNNNEFEKLIFNFITNAKGMIEINKIKVKLYKRIKQIKTSNLNERENDFYLINHITKPQSILLD